MEETVTIAKSEYGRLVKDIEFLGALEAAGVDNWGGYSYVWELMDETEGE